VTEGKGVTEQRLLRRDVEAIDWVQNVFEEFERWIFPIHREKSGTIPSAFLELELWDDRKGKGEHVGYPILTSLAKREQCD